MAPLTDGTRSSADRLLPAAPVTLVDGRPSRTVALPEVSAR
ncbi:MAG: hypothetical protein QM779_08050 [Propionicimonas sp.]